MMIPLYNLLFWTFLLVTLMGKITTKKNRLIIKSSDSTVFNQNKHDTDYVKLNAILLEYTTDDREENYKETVEKYQHELQITIRVLQSNKISDKIILIDEVHNTRNQTRAKLVSPYLIIINDDYPILSYPMELNNSFTCPPTYNKQSELTRFRKDYEDRNQNNLLFHPKERKKQRNEMRNNVHSKLFKRIFTENSYGYPEEEIVDSDFRDIDHADHHRKFKRSSFYDDLTPVDDENSLDELYINKFKNIKEDEENEDRNNIVRKSRYNDEDVIESCKDKNCYSKDPWYSIYNLKTPIPVFSSNIRVYQKYEHFWRIIGNHTTTNSMANLKNGLVSIACTYRKNTIQPMDINQFKVIYSHNGGSNVQNRTEDGKYLKIDISKIPFKNDMSWTRCLANKICNTKEFFDPVFSPVKRKRTDTLDVCNLNIRIVESVVKCKEGHTQNMNPLEIVQDNLPAHKITIKLPLLQNSIIDVMNYDIKISNVIIDSTKHDQLSITISLINYGMVSHEFQISITNCVFNTNNKIRKNVSLAPNRVKKICFNYTIPFSLRYGNGEHKCNVNVYDKKSLISKRMILVKLLTRCFCVWNCACTCLASYSSVDVKEGCLPLGIDDERIAGFEDFLDDEDDENDGITKFKLSLIWIWIIIFLLVILFLGFIKALFGCCSSRVGKWKYTKIHSYRSYEESSKCQRFILNTFSFFILPFAFLKKYFEPPACPFASMDSVNMSWHQRVIQKEIDTNEADELNRLLQECDSIESKLEDSYYGSYNDDNEESDTNFVLTTLTESRESLKVLSGHISDPECSDDGTYVEKLLQSKIVYRLLNQPIGGVQIENNVKYSIRGYFINLGSKYQFFTPIPLQQYWSINKETNLLSHLNPPLELDSTVFIKSYISKTQVLKDKDLLITPINQAPCLNVSIQDISMYEIKSDTNSDEPKESQYN